MKPDTAWTDNLPAIAGPEEHVPTTGFVDNWSAALGYGLDEENITSGARVSRGFSEDRNAQIKDLVKRGEITQEEWGANLVEYGLGSDGVDWDQLARIAKKKGHEVRTDKELLDDMRETLAERRRYQQEVAAGANIPGMLGQFAGFGHAAMLDPPQVVAGAVAIPQKAWLAMSTIKKVGAMALINGGTAAATEPFIREWKSEINSERTMEETVMNIAGAAVFGGAITGAAVVGGKMIPTHSVTGEIDKSIGQIEKVKGWQDHGDLAQAHDALSQLRRELLLGDQDANVTAANMDRIVKEFEAKANVPKPNAPAYDVNETPFLAEAEAEAKAAMAHNLSRNRKMQEISKKGDSATPEEKAQYEEFVAKEYEKMKSAITRDTDLTNLEQSPVRVAQLNMAAVESGKPLWVKDTNGNWVRRRFEDMTDEQYNFVINDKMLGDRIEQLAADSGALFGNDVKVVDAEPAPTMMVRRTSKPGIGSDSVTSEELDSMWEDLAKSIDSQATPQDVEDLAAFHGWVAQNMEHNGNLAASPSFKPGETHKLISVTDRQVALTKEEAKFRSYWSKSTNAKQIAKYKGLNDIEFGLLRRYTGSDYKTINKGSNYEIPARITDMLSRAINKIDPRFVSKHETVVRTTRAKDMDIRKYLKDYIDAMVSGETMQTGRLWSTSGKDDDGKLAQFVLSDPHTELAFVIDGAKGHGADIADISKHPKEYEVLMPKGLQFKVKSIEARARHGKSLEDWPVVDSFQGDAHPDGMVDFFKNASEKGLYIVARLEALPAPKKSKLPWIPTKEEIAKIASLKQANKDVPVKDIISKAVRRHVKGESGTSIATPPPKSVGEASPNVGEVPSGGGGESFTKSVEDALNKIDNEDILAQLVDEYSVKPPLSPEARQFLDETGGPPPLDKDINAKLDGIHEIVINDLKERGEYSPEFESLVECWYAAKSAKRTIDKIKWQSEIVEWTDSDNITKAVKNSNWKQYFGSDARASEWFEMVELGDFNGHNFVKSGDLYLDPHLKEFGLNNDQINAVDHFLYLLKKGELPDGTNKPASIMDVENANLKKSGLTPDAESKPEAADPADLYKDLDMEPEDIEAMGKVDEAFDQLAKSEPDMEIPSGLILDNESPDGVSLSATDYMLSAEIDKISNFIKCLKG